MSFPHFLDLLTLSVLEFIFSYQFSRYWYVINILLTYQYHRANTFFGKEFLMDIKEWAKFQELLLRSQLKVIREFLKDDAEPEPPPRKKRGRSQVTVVYDILAVAKEPLHISEIIKRAKENFNVDIDRESIASAMLKKINKGRMFRKVAPGTFAVLDASGNTS
jgi:hypothetical protein